MKSLNKLLYNRIKNNKVSLICLSVLFLTFFTVILFKFSMIETQISDVIRFRGKSNFILLNVDKNTSRKLEKSKDIKNIYCENIEKIIKYDEKNIQLNSSTENILDLYNANILEGRLYNKENEFVAEKWICDSLGLKINNHYIFRDIINNLNVDMKLVGISSNISANKLRNNYLFYTKTSEDINRYDYVHLITSKYNNSYSNFLSKNYDLEKNAVKINYELNDLLKNKYHLTFFDLKYLFVLGIFLTMLLIILYFIYYNDDKNFFSITSLLGCSKRKMASIILCENIIKMATSLTIGYLFSCIFFFLIKNKLYIFNQELLNKNVSPTYWSYKFILPIIFSLIITFIMSLYKYFKMKPGEDHSLNRKEKYRKPKTYTLNTNKPALYEVISLYIKNDKFMYILFVFLQIISSIVLISFLYYSNLMQYHNKELVSSFEEGYNYDVAIEPVDINSTGITETDLKRIQNLRDSNNKLVFKEVLASAQLMGRIAISNTNLDDSMINQLNGNYKNSLRGAVIKDGNSLYIKSSVYAFNDEVIKNNYSKIKEKNAALLYLPEKFSDLKNKKNITFLYNPVKEPYSENYIYGTEKPTKQLDFDVIYHTNNLMYTGNFYTKNDCPQIILNIHTYKKIFGDIKFNSINLNISPQCNINQAVEDLNTILSKYNLNIVNKHDERALMLDSSEIHEKINIFISICIYLILFIIGLSLYLKIYRKIYRNLQIVEYLGISKTAIRRIFIKKTISLLMLMTLIIVLFSLPTEWYIYEYFKVNNFYTKYFAFNLKYICFTIILNYILSLVGYLLFLHFNKGVRYENTDYRL